MSAARIIHVPRSGRDRKHFARELHKAEQAYDLKRREAEAAYAAADIALRQAHRLTCEAWSALQFIGGPEDPSASIVDAIHGGCGPLEVECRHCNHADMVDLALVVWPREQPVHSLRKALFCRPYQPAISAALRSPESDPKPESPSSLDYAPGQRWIHRERGTTYTEIGRGKMQASESPFDMQDIVIYRPKPLARSGQGQ
jgi:hypothetical protein